MNTLPPADAARLEEHFEDSLRPGTFEELIGQDVAVRNLRIAIRAALERGEALDHVLLSGLPGLGKTTLARLIAFELRAPLHVTMGPVLKCPGDLVGTLTALEERSVLFIDECHRLPPEVEEFLYSAMEDYIVPITLDKGASGRAVSLPLKKFTLVGATTREGMLSDPFRARFGILEKLDWYPAADLVRILDRSARILRMDLNPDSAWLLAERARGTPRVANRYLRRVRDLAQVRTQPAITPDLALEALQMMGVDNAGLDETDRRILRALLSSGCPLGLKTLAVHVGEAEKTIADVYEPFLIQNGFLVRTSRGRRATRKASRHLRSVPPPQRLPA
jgi:Holliday junction DNA helicase RuvB